MIKRKIKKTNNKTLSIITYQKLTIRCLLKEKVKKKAKTNLRKKTKNKKKIKNNRFKKEPKKK
jgi:hypothetical protein